MYLDKKKKENCPHYKKNEIRVTQKIISFSTEHISAHIPS